jgi:hypothetical protein
MQATTPLTRQLLIWAANFEEIGGGKFEKSTVCAYEGSQDDLFKIVR